MSRVMKIEGLENLTPLELLSIVKVGSDYVIPISLASKMKGVSKQAIYLAIESGELTQVSGVLLSTINKYKVDKKKKLGGIRKAYKDKMKEIV